MNVEWWNLIDCQVQPCIWDCQVQPCIWEFPTHGDFTHCRAQGDGYCEPNLTCKVHKEYS
jgi:hypothetical protein